MPILIFRRKLTSYLMKTKLLMTISSIFMGLIGITLSFAPSEVLITLGQVSNDISILFIQLIGALYFGFAVVNWMAKGTLIGGIYSRPLIMGNFAHFLTAGLALTKASLSWKITSMYLYSATIFYVLFAIAFGYLLFANPLNNKKGTL